MQHFLILASRLYQVYAAALPLVSRFRRGFLDRYVRSKARLMARLPRRLS